MEEQKLTEEQREIAQAYQMLDGERKSVVQKVLGIQEEQREHE